MYVMYGKANDVFTSITRNEMKMKGIEFRYIDVDETPEATKYLKEKLGVFQASMLPQVFDEQGNYIGGHDVLKKIT